MNQDKLRHRIAAEAAQLILRRQEPDLHKARLRAARRIAKGWVKPSQFPSDIEIRDELERFSYVHEGDARFDNIPQLRQMAKSLLLHLQSFNPRLIGEVTRDDIRSAGHIAIAIPQAFQSAAIRELQAADYQVENSAAGSSVISKFLPSEQSRDDLENLIPLEIHWVDAPPADGLALEDLDALTQEPLNPQVTGAGLAGTDSGLDRFSVYRMLLAPLAQVQQRRREHPEGDALYHSLQVYQLVWQECSYDEELLLAALLHDVGKAIDPRDADRAGLEALRSWLSERTLWFIENLSDAHRILDNSIGARARRRLQHHSDYDNLLLLAKSDRAGRVSGGEAPTVDEALAQLRDLSGWNESGGPCPEDW